MKREFRARMALELQVQAPDVGQDGRSVAAGVLK